MFYCWSLSFQRLWRKTIFFGSYLRYYGGIFSSNSYEPCVYIKIYLFVNINIHFQLVKTLINSGKGQFPIN